MCCAVPVCVPGGPATPAGASWEPALAVPGQLAPPESGVRLILVGRVLPHSSVMTESHLVGDVAAPLGTGRAIPGADGQQDARILPGSNDGVPRTRRTMKEIPLA